MRTSAYVALGIWLVAAFLWVAKLDERQRIIFDPLRDGPIYFEPVRKGVARLKSGYTTLCLTTIPTSPGASTAVSAPCSTSVMTTGSISTSNILITPTTTGGTYVSRQDRTERADAPRDARAERGEAAVGDGTAEPRRED